MKCPECEQENQNGATICANCGDKIIFPTYDYEDVEYLITELKKSQDVNAFWSKAYDISENEPAKFVALYDFMLSKMNIPNKTVFDILLGNALYLMGSRFLEEGANEKGFKGYGFFEQALTCFKDANILLKEDVIATNASKIEARMDAAATILESIIPGKAQELLGKMKLKYFANKFSDRVYIWDSQFTPSEEEMKSLGNVFFEYSEPVGSAMIFSKVLGELGRRTMKVVLYEETTGPKKEDGQTNEMLCIIQLFENGAFQIIDDFRKNKAASTKRQVPAGQSAGSTKLSSSTKEPKKSVPSQACTQIPIEKTENRTAIKADLKKAAGDVFSHLVNKSKTVKSAIDSGEYKKALDNESVKKVLSWFRVSDERLRTPIYILWTYIAFGILFFMDKGSSLLMLINPAFIISGLMMYGFGYVMRSSEKFRDWLNKPRELRLDGSIEGLFSFMGWVFFFILKMWWWIFCWPAEKIYYLFFDKYTCLNMGLGYLEREDFTKAIEELEKSKVGKNDKEGRLILYESRGFAYYKLERYDDAVNSYTQALNYDANNIDVILFLSYSYSNLNKYNEALSVLRDALKSDPQNVYVYIAIAQCYIDTDMFEDALNYLKQALSIEPDNVSVHTILADTYLSLGDEDSALREANLAVSLDPESFWAGEAKEIIDRIHYGSAKNKDTDDMHEEINTVEAETLAAPTIAAESKAEKLFAGPVVESEREHQAVKLGPVTGPAYSAEVVGKNLACMNAACKKEIPGDSVFCGYCGAKVVLS